MSEKDLWELRSPRGSAGTKQRECAPRLRQLKGLTIGVIDNGFPNAAVVLNRVRQRLLERGEFSAVVNYRRHRSVGYFEPKELLDEFVKNCDALVLGVGAWGGCTTWCIHEATYLEGRGIPTATICTEAFLPLARRETECLGFPSLHMVTIPHPVSGIPVDELERRADAVLDDVVKALVDRTISIAGARGG